MGEKTVVLWPILMSWILWLWLQICGKFNLLRHKHVFMTTSFLLHLIFLIKLIIWKWFRFQNHQFGWYTRVDSEKQNSPYVGLEDGQCLKLLKQNSKNCVNTLVANEEKVKPKAKAKTNDTIRCPVKNQVMLMINLLTWYLCLSVLLDERMCIRDRYNWIYRNSHYS